MIHPEAKFLPSHESVKTTNYKLQWWDKHSIDIPTSKGENRQKETGVKHQGSLKPSKKNSSMS